MSEKKLALAGIEPTFSYTGMGCRRLHPEMLLIYVFFTPGSVAH